MEPRVMVSMQENQFKVRKFCLFLGGVRRQRKQKKAKKEEEQQNKPLTEDQCIMM